MSRKFVGKLIRIMMTKSSSCDILKKKRTIRRGSGSRPKGSYLMDLRFWNYVIPDGSTTCYHLPLVYPPFWNYVIPDGSTTFAHLLFCHVLFWNYVIPDGSTTLLRRNRNRMRFWNYVIPDGSTTRQISALHLPEFWNYVIPDGSTTSDTRYPNSVLVLELCHSRWFYYLSTRWTRRR